jgi:hypothetical protein
MKIQTAIKSAIALALLTQSAVALAGTPAANTFNISAVNAQAYIINGQNNPPLTLVRGQTYLFQMVSLAGVHPFWIKTAPSTGTANGFSDGITSSSGVVQGQSGNTLLTFVVPASAPNSLFYACQNHTSMTALMSVVDDAILKDGFEELSPR